MRDLALEQRGVEETQPVLHAHGTDRIDVEHPVGIGACDVVHMMARRTAHHGAQHIIMSLFAVQDALDLAQDIGLAAQDPFDALLFLADHLVLSFHRP